MTEEETGSPQGLLPADVKLPSRRDVFIGTGLTLGALTVPAVHFGSGAVRAEHKKDIPKEETKAEPFTFDPAEPKRERKSFYDLTDDEVSLFCEAVGAMRDNPGVDESLQWDQWVMIHALHCTQAAQGWRQVHRSWIFLPWHRAYLFFLERQLANVIKNLLKKDGSKFALPYWDWEFHKEVPNTKSRAEQGIASPFFGFDLKIDALNDPKPYNLGLWDGYRFPSINKPRMDPANEQGSATNTWRSHTESTVHATNPPSIKEMLGYSEFEVFGGQAITGPQDPTGPGLLELLPHNLVHDWVGARYGSNRDMGSLRYAALDPVFNLHHGNVDRIWSLYKDAAGNPIEPVDVATWYQQWFNFRDVDGKMKSVTVEDTVRHMKNVTYLEPKEGGPRKLHQELVAIAATLPKKPNRGQSAIVIEGQKTTHGEPLTLTTVQVKEALTTLHTRGNEAPTHSLLVLELNNIMFTGKLYVRVFVNKDDADSKTSIDDEHFVGLFGALDSHAGHGAHKGTTIFRIPLSRSVSNFYKVAPPGKPFTIRLVPVDPSKDFGFTVSKVSFKVY